MRRAVSVLATACVLGLTATACSDSSGGATAAAPEGSVNPTASLKGVKLTMWVAQNSVSEPKQAIEAFEKATGAKITTEVIPDPYESNVPTKLASGVKPDLMFWQPTASTLPFVQPAKNLLQLDNEDWVSKLGTTEKTLGQVDGHRYAAIVTSPAVLGVYYNKAVFKKAGITTMPSSYDEMLADAAKIKAKTDAAPFFEVGGDKWPLQWQVQAQLTDLPQSFWDNLNKNKDTWTNKTIVDAITKYKTKILDGGLAQKNYKTATFVDQGKAVMDGSAGMALNVTALQSEIQATSSTAEMDKKLGWFPIANSSAKAEYSPDQTNGVVAFNTGDTKRQNAARQFMSFWLGPDYPAYIKANKLVSVEPSVPNPDGLPQTAIAQAKALSGASGVFQVKALTAPDMHLALADMIYGKKTPREVAQAAEDQFKQVLKARGVSGF
ncbi:MULTISPECIES: ABC transporter substrate-binding protein [unclassified Streptomyces]|uniref:ABC transporter substrate-binding protein n=1 Tax=unclassified Streptomyces TaxID=2593676 RepID=UPI002E80B7F7|nr:ABC transporter substrate-binding protein [Streptomyces sp. NBC_00589]WTI35252.1 ABC transporter substrate-binding protein [Streptomyces sp. NBC_00775]WUB31074.1 ABC transporter substrate-binding protein [Streptomyces sp. NBC_00589]